jgi:methylmalonyl-CoA mutase
MSVNKKRLFEEFPPVSTETWEEKIKADLKGADYNRKLLWKTMEGFNVRPYYRAEDLENLSHLETFPGEFPFVRGKKKNNNDWFVRQDIQVSDAKKANDKALDILMKGVNSIGFVFDESKDVKVEELEKLLHDICLESIETNFVNAHPSKEVMNWMMQKVVDINANKSDIKGSIDFDPIGYFTQKGVFCKSAEKAFEKAKSLIEQTKELTNFQTIVVHGDYFHNAGSSIVQELAFSLAVGAEYLYQLTQIGLSVNDIAPKIRFKFSVGSNYFMEIAKLRAARLLWAKIVESFNPCCQEKGKMNIHSETSKWNLTIYDEHVNMLRTTTEAMSAALGSTDSLTILPFDVAHAESTDFSERIARNQQTVLKEEAYFNKVVDPASGSYYIENLTDSIAENAWKLFSEVEDNGGYLEVFKANFIQKEIKKVAQQRDMNIAQRREILLGTNQFPNFNETIEGGISDEFIQPKSIKADDAIAEALVPYRGAMAFEALRLRTEKATKRPKVFMLTIGNLAMRKARATFSCNFFACAGFEVVDNLGFKSVEEGVKAAIDAKSDIVVLCSSDDEYATFAPEVKELLKNKAILVVAGFPKNQMDDLKAKGINNFIHVKSNVLETLQGFQKELNI